MEKSNVQKNSISVWVGVNKDGTISMHGVQPKRNLETGVWISNMPFVNSMLYEQMKIMMTNAGYTFDNDPEFLELTLKNLNDNE